MLRNKRGEEGLSLMGKNILEIIVAVICIGLLIYALVSLVQTYIGDQRETQAKGQLAVIDKALVEIELGEEKEIHLLAPTGWQVVSFHKESEISRGYYKKPTSMFNKHAVCICKDKNCEICKETELPLLTEHVGDLIRVVIPKDINVTKLEDRIIVKEKVESVEE